MKPEGRIRADAPSGISDYPDLISDTTVILAKEKIVPDVVDKITDKAAFKVLFVATSSVHMAYSASGLINAVALIVTCQAGYRSVCIAASGHWVLRLLPLDHAAVGQVSVCIISPQHVLRAAAYALHADQLRYIRAAQQTSADSQCTANSALSNTHSLLAVQTLY